MSEDEVKKYNEILKNQDPKFDVVGGYEVILSGVVQDLPETYGENTAKNFSYQLGATPGKMIAQRILEERDGEIFDDPVEATIDLISRLKAYYNSQVDSISHNSDGSVSIILNQRCYFKELFEKRSDIEKGEILCRINRGYFEQALKILTGKKKVLLKHLDVKSDFCKVEVNIE
jgi:hypothetical protein